MAIWCKNLQEMKHFYDHFFDNKRNDIHTNSMNGFRSYFLSLSNGPCIELMQMDSLLIAAVNIHPQFMFAHIEFSVGSQRKVNEMAENLVASGYEVQDGPHWTDDGNYELVVLDPEWNSVQISV